MYEFMYIGSACICVCMYMYTVYAHVCVCACAYICSVSSYVCVHICIIIFIYIYMYCFFVIRLMYITQTQIGRKLLSWNVLLLLGSSCRFNIPQICAPVFCLCCLNDVIRCFFDLQQMRQITELASAMPFWCMTLSRLGGNHSVEPLHNMYFPNFSANSQNLTWHNLTNVLPCLQNSHNRFWRISSSPLGNIIGMPLRPQNWDANRWFFYKQERKRGR